MSESLGRFRGLVLGLAAAIAVAGAGGCSSPSSLKLTPKCLFQSDCPGALVCVQGYCLNKCQTSKDCNPVGRCIMTSEGTTCEAPETVTCHYNSQCPAPLVCAGDFQCRNQCQTAADCSMGQVCTTTSKLCADPLLDPNYDKTTNDFKDASGKAVDATFGMGIDKLPVDETGAGGGGAGVGGGGAGAAGVGGSAANVDGGGGSTGAAGAATATDGGVMDAPGEQPGVVIASSCPGTPQTLFSKVAVGDSNPGYVSGVGVRLPTEMVIFDSFTGYDDVPDAGAGDAGVTGPYVNRIDFQRFDLTGNSKGPPQRLAVVEGHADLRSGESVFVSDVSAAPTGEVALIYTAGNADGAGLYLKLLAPDTLAVTQTIQLQSVGGIYYGRLSHVQWEAGQFVASWVSYVNGASYLDVARFLKDGTPTGSASSIPTNAADGRVRGAEVDQSSVALTGDVFAIAYETEPTDIPSLTFFGADGNQRGQTLPLPFSTNSPAFTEVGATPKGFVTLYNGAYAAPDGGAAGPFATLATFVTPPGPDGGVGVVGGTFVVSGLNANNLEHGARASSDPLGAGFAMLTLDGKATFLYVMDDGSKHVGPAQVIQQVGQAQDRDAVHLMNLGGSYGLSLYTRAEHLTRMAVSGCPATSN